MFSCSSFSGIVLSLLAALALSASAAGAVTIQPTPWSSEHDLDDILASDGYSHAGSLAELNANQSVAETFGPLGASHDITLLIEDAGYRNHNELGIYSVLDNSRKAKLFSGSDSAPSTASMVFGVGGLQMVNGVAIAPGFGTEFGFYLANDDKGFVWYSETGKNADGFKHFVAFEEGDELWGGFEDLRGGGDEDFNDLVFNMKGVGSMALVPEPSAALVFGVGLLLTSGVCRRQA